MSSTDTGDQAFDLLIVGGGITGAALAYLATQSQPAVRVGLIEAGELASGTSSRSSRFLHGGLRYLAQGRVGLVRRLLQGRAELAALVPHLVCPAPFLLPLGPRTPHPAWMLRAAMRIYGALERRTSRLAAVTAGRYLDGSAARRIEPLLEGMAVDGALLYGELLVDDAGLVRALAAAARTAGATVRTHVRCAGLLHAGPRVVGITARDVRSGELFRIGARVVIDATGPWRVGAEDRPQRSLSPPRDALRLARGTHLVLPAAAVPLSQTLVFFAARDGRPLFASPRGAQVVVGTTEVEHQGTPDHVTPTRGEIDYLLESLREALPAARLGRDVPVMAFAGVRALAASRPRGQSHVETNAHAPGLIRTGTGRLDRDYVVGWDQPGLLAVSGGKLTLALDGARRALAAVSEARGVLGLPEMAVPPLSGWRGPLPPSPQEGVAPAASSGVTPAPSSRPSSGAVRPSSSTGRAA